MKNKYWNLCWLTIFLFFFFCKDNSDSLFPLSRLDQFRTDRPLPTEVINVIFAQHDRLRSFRASNRVSRATPATTVIRAPGFFFVLADNIAQTPPCRQSRAKRVRPRSSTDPVATPIAVVLERVVCFLPRYIVTVVLSTSLNFDLFFPPPPSTERRVVWFFEKKKKNFTPSTDITLRYSCDSCAYTRTLIKERALVRNIILSSKIYTRARAHTSRRHEKISRLAVTAFTDIL